MSPRACGSAELAKQARARSATFDSSPLCPPQSAVAACTSASRHSCALRHDTAARALDAATRPTPALRRAQSPRAVCAGPPLRVTVRSPLDARSLARSDRDSCWRSSRVSMASASGPWRPSLGSDRAGASLPAGSRLLMLCAYSRRLSVVRWHDGVGFRQCPGLCASRSCMQTRIVGYRRSSRWFGRASRDCPRAPAYASSRPHGRLSHSNSRRLR